MKKEPIVLKGDSKVLTFFNKSMISMIDLYVKNQDLE
jgi:hypothetical protein